MRIPPTPLLTACIFTVVGFAASSGCGHDELYDPNATAGGARPHPAPTAGAGGQLATGGGGGAAGAAGGQAALAFVIDDLEDGDLAILRAGGRDGAWFRVDDRCVDGCNITLLAEDDGAGSTLAAHGTGSGFTTWGGGFGLSLRGDYGGQYASYDASSYGGVAFRARVGAGSAGVRFGVADGQTDPIGGKCGDCYDNFGADVQVTATWQRFSFTWASLAQVGWGDAFGTIDPSQLVALQWHVNETTDLDLYVDDVELLPAAPPDGEGGTGGVDDDPPYVAPAPAVERFGQLAVVDGRLTSESGEPVQLKGVSSMWLNWEDDGYAESRAALEWMRDNWGVSVIRAAMGVEPDGAYLTDPAVAKAQVETIVNNAIELGVYVIVDWHDHNAEDNQAAAEEFFGEMAAAYGDVPNVIWEPYNEPLAVSWSSVLKPYHEAIVARVREHDADNVIVLGTPNWSQDVDAAARDPLAGDNLMYTLHFYACTHKASLRQKAETALGLGLPIFVTEWGASAADGGLNGVVCEADARQWTTWMATQQISWAAWKLDDCTPDSTCILTADAPLDGGWTSTYLHGHGKLIRDLIREP